MNEWDKAEEEWKKALLFDKQTAGAEKGQKFTEEGLEISMLVRKVPVAYRAHLSLGSLYENKGLSERAVKEYEAAVGIEPNSPDAYFELGRIYFDKRLRKEATYYLEKHIQLGGRNQEEAKKLLDALKSK